MVVDLVVAALVLEVLVNHPDQWWKRCSKLLDQNHLVLLVIQDQIVKVVGAGGGGGGGSGNTAPQGSGGGKGQASPYAGGGYGGFSRR